MPVVYLPHGGGPWPFVKQPLFGPEGTWDRMRDYMVGLAGLTASRPRAILVVSAHWEEPLPTTMSSPRPPMLYDYYNFPPEAYEVQWPAPGAPELAARVRELLSSAGLRVADDAERGFDHGTFVPLKLAYPEADIPTTQLSLVAGLDPAEHLKIGRALVPLRDEGVLILGSGMSYHNMRGLLEGSKGNALGREDSKVFDDWLQQTLTLPAEQRDARLAAWQNAPAARACHPREEHLLPLHVIAGAAADDRGSVPYQEVLMGAHISAVHFG